MSTSLDIDRRLISDLIASRKPGFSLPRPFFIDPDIYRAELHPIWQKSWLFAGHECELRAPGREIRLRLNDQDVRLMKDGPHGLRGDVATRQDSFSLAGPQIRAVAGLLFVCLADTPVDFAAAEAAIASQLLPHGLIQAKVAFRKEYRVRANWKVIFQNNRECYHCEPNHSEYCLATYDAVRDRKGWSDPIQQRLKSCLAQWSAKGIDVSQVNVSSDMSTSWYRANRTPLRPGFVTESLDGQPVAPAMGVFPDPDVGTCRITTFPNFWCHASGDHAVSTQIVPAGPAESHVTVTWLVDSAAAEGENYHLDRLLPFWQRTSEQDWELCERNQAGIQSTRHQPGPFSPLEANVEQFDEWYLEQLRTES
ncbi:MAG TPA: SRPBCC family protein [Pirellulales bacterium]|nr:SRPBCC family protein [Pirellulales bacterium]